MSLFSRFSILSSVVVGAGLLLGSTAARAQTAASAGVARGYDFLTVTSVEGQTKNEAKLLITPAFQGQTETALVQSSFYSLSKNDLENIARNTQIINQQLGAITAAGWELFQVYQVTPGAGSGYPGASSTIPITRYLFRKAKN